MWRSNIKLACLVSLEGVLVANGGNEPRMRFGNGEGEEWYGGGWWVKGGVRGG